VILSPKEKKTSWKTKIGEVFGGAGKKGHSRQLTIRRQGKKKEFLPTYVKDQAVDKKGISGQKSGPCFGERG